MITDLPTLLKRNPPPLIKLEVFVSGWDKIYKLYADSELFAVLRTDHSATVQMDAQYFLNLIEQSGYKETGREEDRWIEWRKQ